MLSREQKERSHTKSYTYGFRNFYSEQLLNEIKHSMRFTYIRGLTRVTNWVRLKFAAMNLKKYVLHKWLYCFFLSCFSDFGFLAA